MAGNRQVFLIDDHDMVTAGLRQLIELEPGLAVCGTASSAEEALRADHDETDLIVTDLELEGTSGIEFIKSISAIRPEITVLVLSSHDEEVYAPRALRSGAKGYVMKVNSSEELINAIKTVLRGEVYLSPKMTRQALMKMAAGAADPSQDPVTTFTDRELEVFERIGQGMGTRDIASQLHLSVKTVETYRANLKRKLDVDSATELVRRAVLWKHDRIA